MAGVMSEVSSIQCEALDEDGEVRNVQCITLTEKHAKGTDINKVISPNS